MERLPAAMIFDLGGVVVRWSNSVSFEYFERRTGVRADAARLYLMRDMPRVQVGELDERSWIDGLFEEFGVEWGTRDAGFWERTFESASYDGEVLDLIQALRRFGYPVAALSNVEPSRVRILRSRGLGSLFDLVVLSCEVGMRKPDMPGEMGGGEVFSHVAGQLGVPTAECVLIDDSEVCVASAKSTGMDAVLFKGVERLRAELKSRGVRL